MPRELKVASSTLQGPFYRDFMKRGAKHSLQPYRRVQSCTAAELRILHGASRLSPQGEIGCGELSANVMQSALGVQSPRGPCTPCILVTCQQGLKAIDQEICSCKPDNQHLMYSRLMLLFHACILGFHQDMWSRTLT